MHKTMERVPAHQETADRDGDARLPRALFFCLLAASFVLMLVLSTHTPLMMDDYDYSFSWSTGQRVEGIGDVLASQAAHYRLWGGRSVVHTLVQLFLDWEKPVFNIANAAMYVLLLLEILTLAGQRGRRKRCALLLAAQVFLLFCIPFFGTVFLWLDGACNYLFGTVLALVPLLIARSEREGGFFDGGWARGVWALPLSFLAGWTNENTACGVLAVMALMILADLCRKRAIRPWRFAAWALELAGVLVMLLAPGNFARAASESSRGLAAELIYRTAVVTYCLIRYAGIPLAAAMVLYGLGRRRGIRMRTGQAGMLALGALLSAYALVASPQISDRSFMAVAVLALSAALTLLQDFCERERGRSTAGLAAKALAFVLCAVAGCMAVSDVCAHEAAWSAQLERIGAAIEAGEKEVTIASVPSASRFTMDILLADSSGEWPNSTLSRYFGIAVRGE